MATVDGGTQWFAAGDDGWPGDAMRPEQVRAAVDDLAIYMESGFQLVTWNGLGFDWQIIADESKAASVIVRELALDHVDMMYHVFCAKGFPLSLKAAAEGMGVGTKLEGVDGAQAPDLWASGFRTDRERVVHYCAQDAALTLRLAIACQRQGWLWWLSRSNRPNKLELPGGWKTVREARQMPSPDTSWMSDPMNRSDFDGWLDDVAAAK